MGDGISSPTGDPDAATSGEVANLSNLSFDELRTLGDSKWALYQSNKPPDIATLDLSIQAMQLAVNLSQDLETNKRCQLHFDLGVRLKGRSDLTHSLGDLTKAIAAFQSSVQLSSDKNPNQLVRYNRLGASQFAYFGRVGSIDALDGAVKTFQSALELTQDGHPDKPSRLGNLGTVLLTRFERTGELEDLEQAVSLQRRAVELTPDSNPVKAPLCSNLGVSFQTCFEYTGKLDYLDQALSSHRRAVELTPTGHSQEPSRLSNLGITHRERFERIGERDDIEQAVSLHRRAIELMSDTHHDKPSLFNNLGTALYTRYNYTGELDDIEQAISWLRHALELTPDGHPDKPPRLGNLGGALGTRFGRTGELHDLEQAISSLRRALELTPDGHPIKPLRFTSIGTSLKIRFQRTGELDDINQAISAHRRAAELTPKGSPEEPLRYTNLGGSLQDRFECTGKIDDIEQAVLAHRRAIELAPDDHPQKSSYLGNLGVSLTSRFERTKQLEDIAQAISAHHRAVELTSDDHPLKPTHVSNLGAAFGIRFQHTEEAEDVEQAILWLRRAAELTPDGDPDKASRFNNLGGAFECRYELSSTTINFTAAIESYIEATLHLSGNPSVRLDAASRCARLLSQNPSFSTKDSLISAHSRIIAVLPEIVWLGYDIQRRYERSSQLGDLVNAAVSAALSAGALAMAIEWLEAGRYLIWAQVLSLRTPLDDLNDMYPKLAESLRRVQQGFQSSARNTFAPETTTLSDIPGLTTNRAADTHRALVIEHDRLLKKIRAIPGFGGFLRPKSFDVFASSLKTLSGPIVFVNVARSRCDAICLNPSGEVTLVPLPSLTLERATDLSVQWTGLLKESEVRARGSISSNKIKGTGPLHRILERMWTWIVSPVLETLDLTRIVYGDRLPNITWCPTGPLTQLPLHAAGIYSDPYGPRVFDFIVSSYAPSLSALLRSHESAATNEMAPNMLIVTQPDTPRLRSPLPGTRLEGRHLQSFLAGSNITTELLEHEQANATTVRSDIGQYSWVHLACHGSQNQADATKSAFELYDEPLTLSDLMGTVSESAELAFLSACQTAVGDEKTPEESAHLAAGMLAVGFKGVVATMWSIGDADAPIVVEAYYRELIALRNSDALEKGETGAAYALHAATRALREKVGEEKFLRWVPFVHFGA